MKRPRHTKRRKAAARSASSSSVSEAMHSDFANKLRAAAEKARGAGRAWLRAAIARADKLGPYATKTLATFKTLWIAGTNKLRTRFPILDVYARALRLHAAHALEAVNRGYRAGVAIIGRYSPRTARAIVACETWLRQSGWRRLGLKAIDVKLIERYFRSVAGPECACWRRFPQGKHPNHLGVTSWVLWTFAQYGISAHKSELEFLLSAQGADGGWPLFAGAQQQKFASSYGTAAAILALHEQAALQPDRGQKKRLAAAVDRGADWLKSHVVAGRARWVDYPAWPEAQEDFLGVSGFALFALHRVGAWWLGSLDRDWLRELPAQAPAALRGEASAKAVQVGNRSFPDETRYYELPWTILATEEVYRSAGILRKVRAVQWLERALAPGATIYALTGREKSATIVAEALLALRNEMKHE